MAQTADGNGVAALIVPGIADTNRQAQIPAGPPMTLGNMRERGMCGERCAEPASNSRALEASPAGCRCKLFAGSGESGVVVRKGTSMEITRRAFGFAAIGGTLTAVPALAKAPFAGLQAPGIYRLKVGAYEVTILSDGSFPLEAKIISGDAASAAKVLEGAFLPKDVVPTSVNEWLVNTGDKLVLVDTGTSNLFGPTLGRMAKNLAAAGIDPGVVDTVILTHMHPDHVGGLLTLDKQIAFSNAGVLVNNADYRFWTSGRSQLRRRMISNRSSKWPAMRSSLMRTPARSRFSRTESSLRPG